MVAPNDFNACNPNIYPSSAGVGFHSDRRSLVGVGERRDVIRTLSVVCKFPTRGTANLCDHVHTRWPICYGSYAPSCTDLAY